MQSNLTLKTRKNKNYLSCEGVTVSMANGKLHESILIFNLPSVTTCPNCKDCAKTCYARKFEKLYPNVRPCRERNYTAAKGPDFVAIMTALIRRAELLGVSAVRVHESGDFFSQEYADMWEDIADRFPTLRFFAYTKSPYRPEGHNWNIVDSILPDGDINYGSHEFVHEKAEKYGYPICPATDHTLTKSTVCGKTCKLCQYLNHVLFYQH